MVVVHHPDDEELCKAALSELWCQVDLVEGGETRQASTLAGLEALSPFSPLYVHIHDAARPFLTCQQITAINRALTPLNGALLATPITDTIKRVDTGHMVRRSIDRTGLYAAQTPQAFPFLAIKQAHESAARLDDLVFTDDSAIAEWANIPVKVVVTDSTNFKITWSDDVERADTQMKIKQGVLYPDIRVGNGYDAHRYTLGDSVTLCGIVIPHSRTLLGHSDADVGLHALTDALLATCSAGDIGMHFPPSDEKWRNLPSSNFVTFARDLILQKQGRIANVDITFIAEEPRIGPYRNLMVGNVAELLSLDHDRVSIKATTNENMGFIGRKEGIAALATASVIFSGSTNH